MEKSELQSMVNDGLSSREIAHRTGKGKSTVSYWLKKHGIKSAYNPYGKGRGGKHHCHKCGDTNPSNFYGHKKNTCATCHNKENKSRGRSKRAYAVDKMGGRCILCGYNDYIGSLDMHHLDPTVKDENFRSIRGWNIERIDAEIEKCVLLCRNCHGAVHGGRITLIP